MTPRTKVQFLIGTRWFGVLGPCSQLIARLHAEGYKVIVFGQEDGHYTRYFEGNCELVKIYMKRSYYCFFHDLLDLIKLAYYFLKFKPVGIHSFNPKPSLIAATICIFFPKTTLLIGVTGLGNTFIRAPRLRPIITVLLRLACKRASYVFFQNPDDVLLFQNEELVDERKIRLFIGPGVDLDVFSPKQENEAGEIPDEIVVLTMARLIWQKGIKEYIEAARLIKKRDDQDQIRFIILGEYDFSHPDCVDPAYVEAAVKDGLVTHLPWTDDVARTLRSADIFVLHSYREGAPRAILEASACCLPTVGSDAIGVRELVIDNVTGFVTPLRDTGRLQEAILRLVNDKELRRNFGKAAFEKIAVPLSLTNATKAQLEMYESCNYF